jgi:hypothetical protein
MVEKYWIILAFTKFESKEGLPEQEIATTMRNL